MGIEGFQLVRGVTVSWRGRTARYLRRYFRYLWYLRGFTFRDFRSPGDLSPLMRGRPRISAAGRYECTGLGRGLNDNA